MGVVLYFSHDDEWKEGHPIRLHHAAPCTLMLLLRRLRVAQQTATVATVIFRWRERKEKKNRETTIYFLSIAY